MNRPNRRVHRAHPDLNRDAPGRIPESLIDAAIDGELDPEIQKEIGNALQYDPARRQEFHDTRDAIDALRMPVAMPDLSETVLQRANRHRRFLPRKLRQQVRAGRVAMAGLLLVGLMGVATLQHMYPRLTTIASQQTPVHDLQSAVEHDGAQIAQAFGNEVTTLRQKVAPVAGIFDQPVQRPGNDQLRFDLAVTTTQYTSVTSRTPLNSYATSPGYAVVTLLNTRAHPGQSASNRAGVFESADAHPFVLTAWTLDDARSEPLTAQDKVPDLP
ncbi:MAG: anti-sigma factor family protein [Phycisphaerales bacterium JB052]